MVEEIMKNARVTFEGNYTGRIVETRNLFLINLETLAETLIVIE